MTFLRSAMCLVTMLCAFVALSSADTPKTTPPSCLNAKMMQENLMDLLHKLNDTVQEMYQGLSSKAKDQLAKATEKVQKHLGDLKTKLDEKKESSAAGAA